MTDSAFASLVQERSPFALETIVSGGREMAVYRHGPKTLADIYRKAFRAPGAPILITDDTTESVGDIHSRAAGIAQRIEARAGQRIGIACGDDVLWIAAFVAVTAIGATAVLLPRDETAAMFAGHAECALILTDARGEWPGIATVDVSGTGKAETALAIAEIAPEQDACIAFTSGSSGVPKGAVSTHRALTTGLMNMMLAGAMAGRGAPRVPGAMPMLPAVLLRTPLWHVGGYTQFLLMLMHGGRIVRTGGGLADTIARYNVTSVTGISDADIETLMRDGAGMVRSIAVAGRKLPVALRARLRAALPHLGIGNGYGLTETNGLVCAIGNHELDARPDTVGRIVPTAECRIVDADGHDRAADAPGRIWLRGAMMMRGYCNADAPLHDDWFDTGDTGYMSGEGFLHVLDREARQVRMAERNIACAAIEDAVRAHAGISDIAALPHRNGVLIAVAGGADDVADFVAERFGIADVTCVRMDVIPRTASGKIAYAAIARLHGAS